MTGIVRRRGLRIAVASVVLAAASVFFVQRDLQPASANPTLVQTGSVITAADRAATDSAGAAAAKRPQVLKGLLAYLIGGRQ